MIFLFTPAALAIVKEVANHANDIMKHGVRANSLHSFLTAWWENSPCVLLMFTSLCTQDNFQKLMQVRCSLNGHHEIVQPGRVRTDLYVFCKCTRSSQRHFYFQ